MKNSPDVRPIRRTPTGRALLTLALGLSMLAALVPLATAGADQVRADAGPTITASSTVVDPAGGTVTVTGSGFDPAGNLGTRPPFMGQPAGVYVVFGRFGDPWRPSQGAPGGARQVITQVWALPSAQYQSLGGAANDDLALLQADGSFTVELDVQQVDGSGTYGIATYAGSGAVNADAEQFLPVTFGTPPTSSTTTAPSTTAAPSTTTAPTTAAPTTTITPPTTTAPGPSGGTGTRSASGPSGQTLTVTPADELDPAGANVRVVGEDYDPALGIYVALCVDQGPAAAPSPCVGGVDTEGSGSTSAWVSSNPPPYGADLAVPFGPGGSFDLSLTVPAADEFVDCLDGNTRCVLATRADHTASSNRSADVRVPVFFVGQTPTDAEPPVETASVRLSTDTVRAGEPLTVEGGGLLAGEQVQIWMLSEPALVAVVVADAAGALAHTFTVPVDLEPGVHHVEVRGLTSGRTARSEDLTVLPAVAAGRPTPVAVQPGGTTAGTGTAATGAGGVGSLALTGSGLLLVLPGLALLAIGAALLITTRSTNRAGALR